jgi:hypothetical protein
MLTICTDRQKIIQTLVVGARWNILKGMYLWLYIYYGKICRETNRKIQNLKCVLYKQIMKGVIRADQYLSY